MNSLTGKLSFQEAWETSTVFLVDEEVERRIDNEVASLLSAAGDSRISEEATIEVETIADFLQQSERGLDVILRDIELSEEKFLRIVSLLRRLGRIPGPFESEWGINKIKSKLSRERWFAIIVAELLVDGKRDVELQQYIPRYYLDALNYREIKGSSEAARRIRYKRSLIGTYGAAKGYKVEQIIRGRLESIRSRYGIPFEQGRSRFIDTDIDFAIPTLDDPWVIVMSTFQETTSSGQSTKARDMLSAYQRLQASNSRYGENRAFVNFVDGGGWLARKRDFQRLVENCHYFINLKHLNILEPVILRHVPGKYRSATKTSI
jgi:hypothetical protein